MTVFGCINVYNDAWALKDCIQSIRRSVRDVVIVVVDGAYAQFPHITPGSTDGTIQLAKALADVIIEETVAWKDEVAKRNRYLLGSEGDTYLVVDADEELVGPFPGLQGNDGDVLITRDEPGMRPMYLYRAFKHRKGIEYRQAHNALFVGSELLNDRPREVVEGCSLFHKTLGRAKAQQEKVYSHQGKMLTREEAKGVYYRELVKVEKEFRDNERSKN